MRKRILATLLAFVLLFSGGAVTAYAYNVAVSGGLKSTPYSLRWHSSMTTAKKMLFQVHVVHGPQLVMENLQNYQAILIQTPIRPTITIMKFLLRIV